ncbi:hypothetical protein GH825_30445 [Bacillus thuringiensis]|nr:hypothetical protein [Bacillus thuringiensis]
MGATRGRGGQPVMVRGQTRHHPLQTQRPRTRHLQWHPANRRTGNGQRIPDVAEARFPDRLQGGAK